VHAAAGVTVCAGCHAAWGGAPLDESVRPLYYPMHVSRLWDPCDSVSEDLPFDADTTGLDNDGNGLRDYPADPACPTPPTSTTTTTTTSTTTTTLPVTHDLTLTAAKIRTGASSGSIRVQGRFTTPPNFSTPPPFGVRVRDGGSVDRLHTFQDCVTSSNGRVKCIEQSADGVFKAKIGPKNGAQSFKVSFQKQSIAGTLVAPVTMTLTHDSAVVRTDTITVCRQSESSLSCKEP